ncbi:MAG: nuclear transport factor 2 family protein [Candidatus Devosia phytovorans]|uniref:Nuclear transport factor 2 family protein n=1 Tax=Candidatus Devosia phytovorans TaxID=3121372 RepID=A0AAJ6B0Q4_9HYPH|nr:nuclear transport factor 2 family protein [Devosia sp.]WEK05960.1 MAG: nuclear transport factor 2 family protein [Devosia sp.]
MTIKLPSSIEAYFTAERDGGPDELAAVFTENAIIKDAGEDLMGHAAIRQWKVDYSNKFGPTVTEPFFITKENGKTLVTAHVSGEFPGSPIDLRYFFILSGDKIAELEITV